ncbi:MAG: tetratricopeptide repeat protein [Persicimonas sp.]
MTYTLQSRSLFLLSIVVLLAAGCATSQPGADLWPEANTAPEGPPDSLDTDAPAEMLRTATDGFVYAVGLDDGVERGDSFVARYSGEWPVEDTSRPTLAAGRVVETYDEGVGLVHLTYKVPDADIDDLELSWEDGDDVEEHLGKGLANVKEITEKPATSAVLDLGSEEGVREGDFYALLRAPDDGGALKPSDMQLSRRLVGVCMVKNPGADDSTCVQWPASSSHPAQQKPAEGQEAVFLEHAFGKPPRASKIQVAGVEGGDEEQQQEIVEAMNGYLETVSEPHADVTSIDQKLDAATDTFHREADEVEREKGPQMLIATSVEERGGEDRLIANYTGVGSSSGPGMVAAPPEGGVDLGPADNLDEDRLEGFLATVWAGMLVHRGQTSEALIQLHQMLADSRLTGPLRWHARDQYAMRWGALDNYREALWLVLDDEAVAEADDDRKARLNALGTRVRLYDFLDLTAQAVSAARTYLDDREEEKPEFAWRSALSMYGEMLMIDKRTEDALEVVEQLEEACPDGCSVDLHSHLSGIFWNVPDGSQEVQEELAEKISELTDEDNPAQQASTRLYQGLVALAEDDPTQAMVGFLESERLYEKVHNKPGQARAVYFAFLSELSRGNPQEAFKLGQEALDIEREINDFRSTAQIYERMSVLFTNPEFLEQPGPFLGSADQILNGAVDSRIAMNDLGQAGENQLGLGGFMLQMGKEAQARDSLSEAVEHALARKRFDVAAMGHLYLSIIAQQEGDMNTFREEVEKAQVMADLSGDPEVQKAVDQALNPEQPEEDSPTDLL